MTTSLWLSSISTRPRSRSVNANRSPTFPSDRNRATHGFPASSAARTSSTDASRHGAQRP